VNDVKPQYLIQFSKQSGMAGEVITINTNLPFGSTQEDLDNEIIKIGNAMDSRTRAINAAVLARTGKTLEELGIAEGMPGFEKREE
jgi:hypothetical protein